MNPPSFLSLLCRFSASELLLATGILSAGCTHPESEICEDTGIVCPIGSRCSQDGQVCIYDNCGDGVIQEDEDEVCDDGNIEDGDGCSAKCDSTEICGDGVTNENLGEVCDDGNTESGDNCSADCKSLEVCGNEITDVDEMCDDGNFINNDGCTQDCKSNEECGNGFVDVHKGEICDPGLTPDECNENCSSNLECGNGLLDKEAGEQCDDGNNGDNTDDCTSSPDRLCYLAVCGDGFVRSNPENPEDLEACDDGGPSEDCNPDCTVVQEFDGAPKGCGDGIINTALDEACDDGKNNGKFGYCDATCKNGTLECGDGVVTLPELCDPMAPASVSTSSGASAPCRDDCAGYENYCGDGEVSSDEVCDNGAGNSDDLYNGCTTSCQLGPHCGDGVTNGLEECDHRSANVVTPNYSTDEGEAQCSTLCTLGPYCGDRIFQPSLENCEAKHEFSVATGRVESKSDPTEIFVCYHDCSGYCGDGVPNHDGNVDLASADDHEGCDLGPVRYDPSGEKIGNGADGEGPEVTTCRSDCTTCGDKAVNHGEACDLGSKSSSTDDVYNKKNAYAPSKALSCNDDCAVGGYCGDSAKNGPEGCDLGSDNKANAYNLAEAKSCNTDCTVGRYCGDELVSNGEACDEGTSNVAPGYHLARTCSKACGINPYCGDGTTTSPEECDLGTANKAGAYGSGTCTTTCQRFYCGDGKVTNGELCDVALTSICRDCTSFRF